MNQRKFFSKKAFLATCLFLLISGGVSAQKTRHYLGGWLYGGYSAMFHGMENTKVAGSGGAGIGGGYQLRHNRFIFNTGVEFEWLNTITKIRGIDNVVSIKDTQGKDAEYTYKFPKYNDKQMVGYVNLPILAGMQFNGNIPLYFLAGVKIGSPVLGKYSASGTLQTNGYYQVYIDTFVGMPNHYYYDKPQKFNGKAGKTAFNTINLMASVEVGVELNKYIFKESEDEKAAKREKRKKPKVKGKKPAEDFQKEKPRVRVALFADYGILNANNYSVNSTSLGNILFGIPTGITTAGDVVPVPTQGSDWFEKSGKIHKVLPTNSLLASTRAKDKAVNPFIVGVKGTIFFDITKPKMIPDPPKEKPKPPVIPPPKLITGKIINVETNEEIYGASVEFLDLKKNNAKVLTIAKTTNGVFNTRLDRKGSYRVTVKVPNFYDYIENASNVGDTLMIYMLPIVKTGSFIVRGIYFATDKTELISTSNVTLDSLADFLKTNPELKFKVVGHTDSDGSDEHNDKLSAGRAKAVVDALIERGIDPSRLSSEGKGEKEPICPANDTPECKAENRRVEFVPME